MLNTFFRIEVQQGESDDGNSSQDDCDRKHSFAAEDTGCLAVSSDLFVSEDWDKDTRGTPAMMAPQERALDKAAR